MSSRYYIELAYDGSSYIGWQVQPNGVSIQGKLQEALSTLLREGVKVVGCGRTDTGVHAQYFVAHIDLEKPIDDILKLIYKLNAFLPKDIVIFNIKNVDSNFHARFLASSRSYEYHVVTRKSPFQDVYSYRPPFELDFNAMNKAALHLLTTTDFTSFSKLHTDVATNNCDVREAVWKQKDEYHWVFHITADRFLRNMVRAIVGTLLDVGKRKISEDDFCNIIKAKDRGKAGVSVPAKALFLTDIKYPRDYINR